MSDWPGAWGALLGMVVRAVHAVRVLQIGTGTASAGLAVAEAVPAGGMLILLERDPAAATSVRAAFAAAGLADRASVMIGDAQRYLHKLSGPFDLIVQDSREVQAAAAFDRVVQLLGPGGTMISHNTAQSPDYNKRLVEDSRLTTVCVAAAGGVAISVKRQD